MNLASATSPTGLFLFNLVHVPADGGLRNAAFGNFAAHKVSFVNNYRIAVDRDND